MSVVAVLSERCKTHLSCLQACPVNAIDILDGVAIVRENCIGCDACIKACPEHAIVPTAQDPKDAPGAARVAIVSQGMPSYKASNLAARAADATGANLVWVAYGGDSVRDAAHDLAGRLADAALVVLPDGAPFDQLAGALAQRLGAALLCNLEDLVRFPDGRCVAQIETHGGRGYSTFDIPAGTKLVATVRSHRDTLVVLGNDVALHEPALELARVLGARAVPPGALPLEAPRLLVIAGTSDEAQLSALAARAAGAVGFGIPRDHELAAACDAVFPTDAVEAMRAFGAAVP